jgi:glycosyltransferase involved in cell wall biosynthesis
MKFLIHSNGPTISTGYGVQTRYLADRLAAAGHEVAVSCTYGHQGPISTWKSPSGHDVRLYPAGYEVNSNDVIHAHAEHWFDGDPQSGWIIPLLDVWALVNPRLAEWQVAAWAPVDHLPVPPDVVKFFHRTGATPIAMSRFGEEMFIQAGLNPVYIPLSVDTNIYKPSFTVDVAGNTVSARELARVPNDAFVVGMVGMNKGWARDRKGFNEAFRAFGRFWEKHQNAVIYLHADQFGGADGYNLVELAVHAGVPEHAIVWADQYAYRLGLPPHLMAAVYTAMDVLLAPSHGEGFCVPLIEAQACGTPVIASDFSAQRELIGAGWKVTGQLEWDAAQHSSYLCPYVEDVYRKLEEAYASDLAGMQAEAVEFARQYDTDHVFATGWQPFIATLEPPAPVEKPKMERVDVIVPFCRPENYERLIGSFSRTSDPDKVRVILVADVTVDVPKVIPPELTVVTCLTGSDQPTTYSEKVNRGNALRLVPESDWVLVVGDDTEATEGWFEAAQAISDRYDMIGTNDSEEGRVRNPDVAAGRHADHFFVRRSYIDDEGASLDGPGVLMPEAYQHWFTDREVIELARARGVYGHAHDCRIIHHHPGFDGREDLRAADPVYMKAVDSGEADAKTFRSRLPLIEAHRVTRART